MDNEDWLVEAIRESRKLLESLPPSVKKALEHDAAFRAEILRREQE